MYNNVLGGIFMRENIMEWMKIILPALVTIIGFIVNFFLTRNSIRREIEKKKSNIALEELSKVPLEVMQILDEILDNRNKNNKIKETLNRFKGLMAKIFAYGTKDSIKIVSNMQEYNYKLQDTTLQKADYKVIAYYIILACQIKYDLTGVKVNPEYWYKMRLTDYQNKRLEIDSANNDIVKSLGLNESLLIK